MRRERSRRWTRLPRLERAYQYVLDDPVFRVGTRPRGPLSIESKRFIVELYERYSGKRLL